MLKSLILPQTIIVGIVILLITVFSVIGSKSIFYAEPGYIYHVRTLTGNEEVINNVGYHFNFLGRYNAWKRAMTVQSISTVSVGNINSEKESQFTSAALPPLGIMFLDQVDAHAEATVRFSIPSNRKDFLNLAHEYRTPENLLRTALIPAFKETLQSNASLMSAEEYYSGGRSEFNAEFEKQMSNGVYLVKRMETEVFYKQSAKASANAALGTDQKEYGDKSKMIFIVKKLLDSNDQPRIKVQRFQNFAISVVDARVTDIRPNKKFVERMQLKQKASADRAIAREQRIQEEEQKLLVIARGERKVAERQVQAKVIQIERTTEAETEKQLAITDATKTKERATIARITSEIFLEKAKIDAETQRTLAKAEAYKKRVIIEADNALAQKLAAETEIHRLWAVAFARRNVPTNVFGGGQNSGVPIGSDSEAKAFMQLLTLDAAKRLSYDRTISTK